MRLYAVGLACVLALTACSSTDTPSSPQPTLGAPWEVQPPPPAAPSFQEGLGERLAAIEPFTTDSLQVVRGPSTVAEPLEHLHPRWAAYLEQLQGPYPGLQGLSSRTVLPVEQPLSGFECAGAIQRPFERLGYCRAASSAPNTVQQTGLVVLEEGFTARLQSLTEVLPPKGQLWVVMVVGGMAYLPHITEELRIAGITMPRGPLFDWCLAGIGLRPVFSSFEAGLAEWWAVVDELIGKPSPSIAASRGYMMRVGYTRGRIESCSYATGTGSQTP